MPFKWKDIKIEKKSKLSIHVIIELNNLFDYFNICILSITQ